LSKIDKEKENFFQQIKKEIKETEELLDQIHNSKSKKKKFFNRQDWIEVYNSENKITHYKVDSPLYAVKMEGLIERPMIDVLSVFYEIGKPKFY
jgi:hypothetical protein